MKFKFFLSTSFVFSSFLFVQVAQADNLDHSDEHLNFIRYQEDFSYLKDAEKKHGFEHLKNIPVFDSDLHVSFGGSLRERYEYYSHDNFGIPQKDGDGYLIHRLLVHTDLNYRDQVRLFVELGNTLTVDKTASNVPYEDQLDLQQAFLEFKLPSNELAEKAYLRVGRQEMAFGDQRLISIRDSPGVRRTFDGVRLGGENDQVKFDAFYTNSVTLKKGTWDDRTNQDQDFWGIYSTVKQISDLPLAVDLYYLGILNKQNTFAHASGREKRHSVGYRLFGKTKNFDYDFENLYQFGEIGDQDIRAIGFTFDGGYKIELDVKSRVGFKLTASTGDKKPDDNKLTTYNGLFPKMAYFNQAGLLGTQNMIDFQPNISFFPTDKVKLTLAHDFLWRMTSKDAVYTAAGRPIANTAGEGNRFTSGQTSLDIDYKFNRRLSFNGGSVYISVSDSLKEAGGKDTLFNYLTMTYLF